MDRHTRIFAGLVLLLVATLIGCTVTRENYGTLSKFFDGVPNPDEVKKAAATPTAAGGIDETIVTAAMPVISRHKPYVDRQCAACHSNNGQIQEFEQAYTACVKCHGKVSTAKPLMHGPVAREACNFCHTGHESEYPALLKESSVKVCTQCHDSNLLSPKPAEHVDGKTECISCHYGHGGTARNFLKEGHGATTEPAVLPAGSDLHLETQRGEGL